MKYGTTYQMAFGVANSHLIQITLTVSAASKSEILFRLPAWRPGRYQIQNYAGNVQDVKAVSESGLPLPVRKTDKQSWLVQTNGAKTVSIQYNYYAGAMLDAGNSHYNTNLIYFNGSNLLMYTDETRNDNTQLDIHFPDGWQVATQLDETADPKVFTAETYDDLIDAPTIISPTLKNFPVTVQGATINIWFQGEINVAGKNFYTERFKRDITAIVDAQFRLMKDVPFKDYHFLFFATPYPIHHGVEHKNSCVIALSAEQYESNYDEFLSITSHEFFHVWNIKRIKPDAFMPYDYSKECYTRMLYVSEGFTSYYGDLFLRHAGLWDATKYLNVLAAKITKMQQTYGRLVQPLSLSSFDAWLSGYGAGRANSTVSFYSKGELVGILLDLEIRYRTNGSASLDDVMRTLNTDFAQQGKGFSSQDFKTLCEHFAGGSLDAFFAANVDAAGELDYNQHLGYAGLRAEQVRQRGFKSGFAASVTADGFPVVTSVEPQSAAFLAGLDAGDEVIAIGGKSLKGISVAEAFESLAVPTGEAVQVSFLRNKTLMEIVMKPEPLASYRITKKPDAADAEKRLCEAWLGTRWDDI
jgi:predicted metalloprotease with PDZ domain